MDYLKNVLIKETRGADYVFIVDNLPKGLLYRTQPRKVLVPTHAVDYSRYEPKEVMAYVIRNEEMPDEPRNRKLTGETEDVLIDGIELSQTGDEAYVFDTQMNESKLRLKAIDDYIRATLPPLAQVPARVNYATQPGSFTAGPKPLSQIPRVVLPAAEPVSPPTQVAQVSVSVPAQPVALEKKKHVWTDEQRKAAGERLKAAREAKKTQPTV